MYIMPLFYVLVPWFNLAARHLIAAHSLLPLPQWDGEENGQKVKIMGRDKDSLIRQQRKE